jgi:hypothetical protein
MAGAVRGLPAPAAHAAVQEVASALQVADHLGPAGELLREAARNAYVHSMHTALITGAGMAFVAGLIALAGLPGRAKHAATAGESLAIDGRHVPASSELVVFDGRCRPSDGEQQNGLAKADALRF